MCVCVRTHTHTPQTCLYQPLYTYRHVYFILSLDLLTSLSTYPSI